MSVGLAAAALAGKRPGYITGTAKTECGKSISSFVVSAHGFDGKVNVNPSGLPFLGQTTGRNGRYALRTRDSIRQKKPVNALVRAVDAKTTVHYHGHRYELALYPQDGKPNGTAPQDFKGYSGKGIIRNFVLRSSGLKPGFGPYKGKETEGDDSAAGAFYGGNVNLYLSFGTPAATTMTLTFTPTSPLVDGCPAKTITRSVALGNLNSYYLYLHSIPLGFYVLSGTLSGATSRPLQLHSNGDATTTTNLPLQFLPTPELPDGSSTIAISAS